MSRKRDDELSLSENDDDTNESSSPIIIDDNTTLPSYNSEKMANTALQQFFYNIRTHDNGTKSAKCLLCHTIVKQSTTSTYNYGRHVERKHSTEMNKWKSRLQNNNLNSSRKQPTIQQSFAKKSM